MKTTVLVGAAIIKDGKILLLKRSETKSFLPGYYDLPGGKLKESEDPNQAVLRELKEETGLEGEIIRPYNAWSSVETIKGIEEHIVDIDYLVRVREIGRITLSAREHSEYMWVGRHHLPEKLTPELKATIIKALSSAD